jgi:acetolactate synthase small subunit
MSDVYDKLQYNLKMMLACNTEEKALAAGILVTQKEYDRRIEAKESVEDIIMISTEDGYIFTDEHRNLIKASEQEIRQRLKDGRNN